MAFEVINQKIRNKLLYLAYIRADSFCRNGIEYFKYKEMKIYKLRSISSFWHLVRHGYIWIYFNVDLFRKGPKIGKIHDRGTAFEINHRDLERMYDVIVDIKFD